MRYILAIFIVLIIPFSAFANIVINEIAWMGTANSSNDEWIEIYNDGFQPVDLNGWTFSAVDGTPSVNFSNAVNKIIPANGYYLLERTDDSAVPGITADLIFTGALSNSGENLILKNKDGDEIDRVNASSGWPAGDNATKETMQKTGDGKWITAKATPKAKNQDSGTTNQNSQNQIIEPDQSKQIKVEAGEDKIVFVGQKTIFSGKAYGFNNEEIKDARFLWNFGDGTINEGNPLSHIYRYLGEYIVILNASSGIYANRDQLAIKVIAPPIKITGLKPGENGFVEISNQSDYELDISGFNFSDGKKYFYFPENSVISPQSRLLVPGSVSGINFALPSLVKFYYPDSSLIQEFKYEGEKLPVKNIISDDKTIIAKSSNLQSSPSPQISDTKDIVKKEDILASSAIVQDKNKGKQRSIYFWLAIVFGIASFSGIVSFFFAKSGENDKMPQR